MVWTHETIVDLLAVVAVSMLFWAVVCYALRRLWRDPATLACCLVVVVLVMLLAASAFAVWDMSAGQAAYAELTSAPVPARADESTLARVSRSVRECPACLGRLDSDARRWGETDAAHACLCRAIARRTLERTGLAVHVRYAPAGGALALAGQDGVILQRGGGWGWREYLVLLDDGRLVYGPAGDWRKAKGGGGR
jgi:hypothetical protein